MKKNKLIHIHVFVFVFLFCSSLLEAQNNQKPRFLTIKTPLCPIDLSKTYSREGLLSANKETISIFKDTVLIELKDNLLQTSNGQNSIIANKGDILREIKTDTVLTRTLMIDPDFAFDVIAKIGSYSIIEFWQIEKQKNIGLFEYLSRNKSLSTGSDSSVLDMSDQTVKGLTLERNTGTEGEKLVLDLSKSAYILPTSQLMRSSKEFVNKNGVFNLGILFLPVKIRPFATESGQFDFSDGFSLGTTFSLTYHHNWVNDFTHNLLLYLGTSNFTLDSSKIKEVRDEYKISAFSPAIGYMMQKNQIQISLLVGIDFPSGSVQKNWVYRNQPWIGVGLGFGLFKLSDSANSQKGDNSNNQNNYKND